MKNKVDYVGRKNESVKMHGFLTFHFFLMFFFFGEGHQKGTKGGERRGEGEGGLCTVCKSPCSMCLASHHIKKP